MTRRQKKYKEKHAVKAWLYLTVYTSRASLLVVILLLTAFLIQPVNQAFANEDESIPVETSNETIADSVREQDTVTEQVQEVDEVDSELVSDDLIEDVIEVPTENITEISNTETEEESSDNDTENITEVDDNQNDSSIEEIINNDETDDMEESIDSPENNEENDVGPLESNTENDDEQVSVNTTTEQTISEEIVASEIEIPVTDDNYYQFNRQSCVAVGDGTYHCSVSDTPDYDTQSVVYAETGSNGNLEIFLRTAKGSVEQLTDNSYDDSSPFYDAESLRVVWQRLVDGRYQVIVYDILEAEETQLTFSRTNNMEPKVSDEGIVWQAWDGNDWEIMYFDGRYTDQITDNLNQDVTPVIEDDYILWSVIGGSDQEAKVYSIKSGEVLTIRGHEGGSIANPRFVLVYDTKFENGDILTQGFDPATGLSAPISAKPAPLPVDIPESDPIGEIRALVHSKVGGDDEGDIDTSNPDTSTSTIKTATTSDTLNLKTPQDLQNAVIATTTQKTSTFELTDYDLVLTDTKASTLTIEEISDETATSTQ